MRASFAFIGRTSLNVKWCSYEGRRDVRLYLLSRLSVSMPTKKLPKPPAIQHLVKGTNTAEKCKPLFKLWFLSSDRFYSNGAIPPLFHPLYIKNGRPLFHGFKVRLVVGPASKKVLREAGASGARMVVLRAGKSFPEQEASDADAETIGQLVEARIPLADWLFLLPYVSCCFNPSCGHKEKSTRPEGKTTEQNVHNINNVKKRCSTDVATMMPGIFFVPP